MVDTVDWRMIESQPIPIEKGESNLHLIIIELQLRLQSQFSTPLILEMYDAMKSNFSTPMSFEQRTDRRIST